MLISTRGIFLNSIKYSDSSVIAHIYTEKFGVVSYIISGVHGKKSVAKVNLLQSLFLLDMIVYHKENSNVIQRVKTLRMIKPLSEIPFDIKKSSQAMFIAEVLTKILKEEESNSELFEFLFSSISHLDTISNGISNFLVVFLFKLTKYLGIQPTIPTKNNMLFDISTGTFVEKEPNHHLFLDVSQTQKFTELFSPNFNEIDKLSLNNNDRRELLDCLVKYYKVHLEINSDFKSLAVIKEIMA